MKCKFEKYLIIASFVLASFTITACGGKTENTSLSWATVESTISSETSDEKASIEETVSVSEEVVEETVSQETEATVEEVKEEITKPTSDDGTLKTPANSGRLHVDGTYIKNENDEIVQLKGLSTHGLAWFPGYVNNALFSEFRTDWNCNVIRLAMYTAEYGGYCAGGNRNDLKKLIANGVKYATDNDMYVIIDWHILSDGNPNTNKAEAKAFFKEMSSLYSGNNNVIYEICNEPNGGTSWSDIKKYAEEVIPVIRENDKNAIIIVGTPTWSQEVDKAAKNPITGYDNIMYALHFYADTHKDGLRKTMKKAIKDGLPIFVTEYGICDASGNGAINEKEAGKWMELMNEYSVSSCAWNISNKSETSAIFGSWTSKTHGFTNDDLSSSGKWIYSMLTGKTIYEPSGNASTDTGNESDSGATDNKANLDEATKLENGNLSVYLKEVNSWEGENGSYHQYELTIVNNGAAVSSWSVDLPFSGPVTLSDGWCAKYSTSGSTLTVSNESYNGSIDKGCATRDIGFIVIY